MLKIGDFSKLSRISIRMLRHYDEICLLTPDSVDEQNGYRYYSEAQLPKAARIQFLKEMGFGLTHIGQIMQVYREPEAMRGYLLLKQAELQEQAEKTSRQLRILGIAMNQLRKDESMMEYNVTLKEVPQRNVASLRKVIPAYNQEGILWRQMTQEVMPQNIRAATPSYSLALFHDKEHKEHDPDVEIQIAVEGTYQDTENVRFFTAPAVKVASCTYQGGYDQLTMVNLAVAQWVKENGYSFSGPMFSIYHVSPAQTENPDELVTEVCFPVL